MYASNREITKKGVMKPITTTIPIEIWQEAGKRRIPLQHIFMRGWQSINNEPQVINRTRELEISIEKLNKVIASYRERLYALENA
jgi:hypothetical protein